ncbi:hypothetical protein [Clostridium magnum]|uniref:Helix-turn-helix domain protein n=1 Tax=Clostridium magnum DSM 2767 TaxID=1121326 RepID=A0A161WJ26_9CLOT|nr:hypothetical protein [Clostridium magnum]KZL91715.1 helix-turn-helix domain protein [Clostridium magnum DSM 2767]SHJ38968.1 hypothetical protein SAMN02745944_05875 [Clostridium magnum DSM 2767]
MEYYTLRQVKEILSINNDSTITNGLINSDIHYKIEYIENKPKYFISKDQLDNYIDMLKKDYVSIQDITKEYSIQHSKIYRFMVNGLVRYIKHFFTHQVFILKEDMHIILENKKVPSFTRYKKFEGDIKDLQENYYSLTQIKDKYGLGKITIRRAVIEGKIICFDLPKRGYFFEKEPIDNFFQDIRDNYIILKEASVKYGVSKNWLLQRVVRRKKAKKLENPLFDLKDTYIYEKDLIPITNQYKKKKERSNLMINANSIEEKIDIAFIEFNDCNFPITLEMYVQYSKYAVGQSNRQNKDNYINLLYRTYERLNMLLKKEVYSYFNEEIKNLFMSTNLFIENKRELGYFFKYIVNKYPNKCRFNDYPKAYGKQISAKGEKDIYSKVTWKKYFDYINNIDAHIYLAFEDSCYANTWLFILLNLFLLWRKSDIVKLRVFNLPICGIDNIEWFKNNEFNLGHAELIIKEVELHARYIINDKRNAKANFVIPINLKLSTTIAIICCYKHAISENRKTLLRDKGYFNTTLFRKFFKDTDLDGFSNRKANSTLATLGYEMAINTKGMSNIAFSLGGDQRSHKYNEKTMTGESLAYYLVTADGNYDSSHEVSHNLFLRGHFGELYHLLVEVAYGSDINNFSINEITKLIQGVKRKYEPKSLEKLSSFFISPQICDLDVEEVVLELIKTDKKYLLEKIKNLLDFKLPSKLDKVQCYLSPACIKPVQSDEFTCIGCKYSLPTIYVLKTVEEYIDVLVSKYNKLKHPYTVERSKIKYMLSQCIRTIMIAQREYELQGNGDFIKSFFDVNGAKDKIAKILINE